MRSPAAPPPIPLDPHLSGPTALETGLPRLGRKSRPRVAVASARPRVAERRRAGCARVDAASYRRRHDAAAGLHEFLITHSCWRYSWVAVTARKAPCQAPAQRCDCSWQVGQLTAGRRFKWAAALATFVRPHMIIDCYGRSDARLCHRRDDVAHALSAARCSVAWRPASIHSRNQQSHSPTHASSTTHPAVAKAAALRR
ncbi:hypothetical protein C8E89_13325 [Mycolicibacterium moriokaense]|uniref:Uncharacterized protein n=1 Tax=Mycolicibacterium moriokaense TaxID=39691 RepID=A0A318H7Z5_9MYCO|nr:hypothetical protein C8E89_13325 [Mycolicibacterium moriokaense]